MMMNFQSISALFLTILAVGGWAHEIDVKSKGMFKMHIGTYTHSRPRIRDKVLSCIRDGIRNEMVTGFFSLSYLRWY